MTTEDGRSSPVPAARTGTAGAQDSEEALVARLRQLSTALDDEPGPDFRTATRDRLVAMAAVRTPEPARPGLVGRLLRARAVDSPPSRWRRRATAGLAGAALAVSVVGTLVALSADAQPGDLLYGLRRGTEQRQLAPAGEERALTLLQSASTRLDELADAADDPALVVQTLATMDSQTTEGTALLVTSALGSGSPTSMERLADWTEGQSADLAELQPALPPATVGAAQASLELLEAVDSRAAAVSTALDCTPVPTTQGTDDLGPIPGACATVHPVDPSSPGGAPPTGPVVPPGGQPSPGATPAPSGGGTGGTSAGDSGSTTGGNTNTGGSSPTAGPLPPVPSLPVPLPGLGGGTPAAPSPTTTGSRPPLIDTPLPICLPPLLC